MQTRAEMALVDELKRELESLRERGESPTVLNLGASTSVSIENQLRSAGFDVTCDRVDVEDPVVDHPMAGHTWRASAHAMPDVPTGHYSVVFANYVFEHIKYLDESIEEVSRVLKPGGVIVLSIPNPSAPEFWLAAMTPLWFHSLVRGERGWKLEYAFSTPQELIQAFERHGFSTISVRRFAHTYTYLNRFAGIRAVSRQYDKIVDHRGWTRLMGDTCVAVRKSV
jgi:SAM-dependent methyltransferase